MTMREPATALNPQFSDQKAAPATWAEGRAGFEQAGIYWLSTVRPDGRPHVTPLIGIWLDDTFCFCTGGQERKALNLAQNAHCAITTGCNSLQEGIDLVVEGDAVNVSDEAQLQRVADRYREKYGEDWDFSVRDGGLVGGEGNVALVFAVRPVTAFGFAKDPYGQTRWTF